MANLRFPVNSEEVVIIGSEYCAGYIDLLGQWNSGFYCPSNDQSDTVFCCGSDTHRYCCTKKDQMIQDDMEGLSLVIGMMVGISTALLLLTIIACICCPCCPNYKKKDVDKYRGSVYRLTHPGSSDSRTTASYSVSNGASGPSTPVASATTLAGLETGGKMYRQGIVHSNTLPHSLSHHTSFRVRDNGHAINETARKYGTLGRQPREQPPAYHILPRSSYLLIPQDTPDLLSETKIQADTALASLTHSLGRQEDRMEEEKQEEEEDIYQSTKF